ncbi:MAG: hypothetical protein DWI58_00550 [Chloroflexi bacterium]|nr:MAG: hypothetical protein DWI58_00550 [Chloroflexota bacterium]
MDEGSRLRAIGEISLRLLRRARFHLRRSPGLAVVSLLIAIALWVVVSEEENPTRIELLPASVTLEAANLDSTLAVASTLPSVQIRVAAPDDRWATLSPANFRAYVDLNGTGARAAHVPVQVEVLGVSRVRVLDVTPATITVNLEEVITKQVAVRPRVVGTLPRGYELGAAVPDRASVEVTGARSLVALINAVSANVNVTGLTVGLEQAVPLTAVSEGGGEIRGVAVRPPTARVAVAVTQNLIVRTLPLEVEVGGQPAAGYRVTGVRITPATIRVEGPIEVLQGLDSLRLPRVDVSGQQADMRTTVRVQSPDGLRAAVAQATVEVSIAPVPGSISLTLVPEVSGVRSGFVARANVPNVTVVLDGPQARLNALAPGALRATIDGSSLPVGVAEARVVVAAPEGVSVREVQPAVVSVTITR